jgi:hypothetical protein
MAYGAIRVYVDLEVVKRILLSEGFYEPLLQERKKGQVFGLIKPLNELVEVHIRGYEDGTLDAEVELSREYLEHLWYKSKPYYGSLIDILRRHNIPFHIVKPIPPDPMYIEVPRNPTKWKPLVILAVFIIGGIYLLSKVGESNEKSVPYKRKN